MSDEELTTCPPPGLFFAGSDDEDIIIPVDNDRSSSQPNPPSDPQTPTGSPASASLFFAQSDDDEVEEEISLPSALPSPSKIVVGDHDDDDDDDAEVLPAASIVPVFQPDSRYPERPADEEERPAKKMRLSPAAETRPQSSSQFSPMYLGDVLVENAWSTVSGKGYCKPGDSVVIRRDGPDSGASSSKAPTEKKGKKPSGRNQIPITRMLKPQNTSKPARKKVDTVVRVANSKGFDFARLPTEVAAWISKLLDFGMIEVRGTMTDCPEKLATGVGLMVTLHVYILARAFEPLRVSHHEENSNFTFNEGYETQEESYMRERKAAVLKLLDVVGLKPQAGARSRTGRFNQKYEDAIHHLAKHKAGKITKEIVGDGEEIEVDTSEELSGNDINLIYQKAQQNDNTMPMMEPADSFNLNLRGYQKQALDWMFSIEHDRGNMHRTASMHPLWSQYVFPPEPSFHSPTIDLTADEKAFYFNPYSGEMSLEVPRAERKCRGGMVRNLHLLHNPLLIYGRLTFFIEMGMGKTIMISALIQTSRLSEQEIQQDEPLQARARQLRIDKAFRPMPQQTRRSFPPLATLIVAPTSLLGQWAEEIQRSSKTGTVKVIVWHGQNRLDLDAVVEGDKDSDKAAKVVVTSYGVLASEHAKPHRSPVFDIYWLRIVLDEAHACKSRTSKTAKAVYDLRAKWRWAVTGTPIVNKLEDLYSLLRFLDHKPWSEYAYFRSFITLPFLARDPKTIEIVQVILETVLLRREKNMLDVDGKRIVELPPKEVTVETLEFSSLERKIYDSIYLKVKQNFDQLEAKGLISRNYTHILAMLMRLRRAVLHPSLVLANEDSENLGPSSKKMLDVNELVKKLNCKSENVGSESSKVAFAEGVLANLAEEEATECPICFDIMDRPTIIPECAHQCCMDCILTHIATCEEKGQQPNCFACGRGPIKANELLEVVRKGPSNSQPSASILLRRNDFQSSTKLDALLKHLRRLKEEDPSFRAVVFSQFTSFLDLIQVVLQRERYDHCRFDGTMDVKRKNSAISEFRSPSNQPKILIVSLKAGGVGLNLTTANHVFMMDCWWNAATENQAIDRVHRIGQDKPVYVTQFIVSNTIEGRILQIQKRKTAIIREAFRGSGKEGRADPQSIENLKIMFGDID